MRAPGARRRCQQAGVHARHPQRDASSAIPTCSNCCSQTTGAAASARGGTKKDGEATTRETAYPLPIFGVRDGKFTSHYSLTFIEAAQMAPGVPKLTDARREAIDVLMKTAEELCFEMTLEPGDLQLINSHVTYHGRTPVRG